MREPVTAKERHRRAGATGTTARRAASGGSCGPAAPGNGHPRSGQIQGTTDEWRAAGHIPHGSGRRRQRRGEARRDARRDALDLRELVGAEGELAVVRDEPVEVLAEEVRRQLEATCGPGRFGGGAMRRPQHDLRTDREPLSDDAAMPIAHLEPDPPGALRRVPRHRCCRLPEPFVRPERD